MEQDEKVIRVVTEIEDFLIPRKELDAHERALYYHLFRHSRMLGVEEMTFVISASPKRTGMTEFTARDRLRSLEKKDCLVISELTRNGVRLKLLLPEEIPGCLRSTEVAEVARSIEEIDFFKETKYRSAIFQREQGRCFYCLRKLSADGYALDHATAQVDRGDNSYRNIVAACHECNSRKAGMNAEDYCRLLYREGLLSADEMAKRMDSIGRLRNGDLIPTF